MERRGKSGRISNHLSGIVVERLRQDVEPLLRSPLYLRAAQIDADRTAKPRKVTEIR